MMKVVLKLLLFWLALFEAIGSPTYNDREDKEYYWRSYLGTIPDDAVPGGLDENDNVTYIGQAFLDLSTIPGEIHDNLKTLYFEFGGPRSTKENIKILCSSYPELFEWIPVTEKNYKFLWSTHIVQGGYYYPEKIPFLIGRILYKNKQHVLGEVLAKDQEITLFYAVDGTAVAVKNNMELLSFNAWMRFNDKSKQKHTSMTSSSSIIEDSEGFLKPGHKGKSSEPGCAYKLFNLNFN